MARRFSLVMAVLALISAPGVALAQALAQAEDHSQHNMASMSDVGTVSFETSCAPAVKAPFNHAVAELHSFWFPEARAGFEGVLKTDPSCAIAYWGIALTYWGNPFAGLRAPQAITAGKAAIDKGQATGSPTPREKGYIDAVAGLFSSADPGTQRARVLGYEKATEAVAAQNPNDVEARIFWALAITQTALPTDKSFAQNLRSAEILEPLYKKMPNHPGLAHYIIHTYDVPALADKALPAARAYAEIAPAVPHALHMPSHTFTRVGLWKESVATNIKSAAEAERTNGTGEALHAMDYETYAYLQMAQDAQAKAVLEHAVKANAAAPTSPGPAGGAQHVRAGGDSRALRDGAPAVGRGDGADAAAGAEHAVHRGDDAFRARGRRGPGREARRRGRRHRAAQGDSRSRDRDEGRVLGRAGRHPAPRRRSLGRVCERPEGRGDHVAGRRGRRRGSDRQVGGDAGPARAGARAVRLHAARGRPRRRKRSPHSRPWRRRSRTASSRSTARARPRKRRSSRSRRRATTGRSSRFARTPRRIVRSSSTRGRWRSR